MSTIKVDTVRPVTTDGSLSLKGDSGGSATTNGISVDSSGDTYISGDLKFNSGYGSVATAYGCRAWVNFRGTSQSGTLNSSGPTSGQYTATVTGATTFTIQYSSTTYTVTTTGNHEIGDGEGVDLTISGTSVTIDTQIRASGNVSSITDSGAGNYRVNFTTAMSDANYSAVSTITPGGSLNPLVATVKGDGSHAYSTTQLDVYTWSQNSTSTADSSLVCVTVFR